MRTRKVLGLILLALISPLSIYGVRACHNIAKKQSPSNYQIMPADGIKVPSGKGESNSDKRPRRVRSQVVPVEDARIAVGDEGQNLTEQFKSDKTCFDAMTAISAAKHVLDYCRSPDRSSDPRSVAQCNRLQAMFRNENPTMSDFAQRDCPSPEALPEQYMKSLYAAARAGDINAQYCFIDRDGERLAKVEEKFDDTAGKEMFEAELEWTREGIERGDWRIVSYVASHLGSHGNNSSALVVAIPGLESTVNGSSLLQYSLDRLLRFGAIGVYAQMLDDPLQALTGTGVYKGSEFSRTVSAADAAAADAWARAMFEQYFAHSAAQSSRPAFCDNPYLAKALGH